MWILCENVYIWICEYLTMWISKYAKICAYEHLNMWKCEFFRNEN